MKLFVTLITIFMCSAASSQNVYNHTLRDGKEFIKLLRSTSFEQQIKLIKGKIVHNTTFINKELLDGPTGEMARCKVLFTLKFRNQEYKIDLLENPKLVKIVGALNQSNVSKVHVFEDVEALPKYGSDGRCGAIQLITEDYSLIKRLRNVL